MTARVALAGTTLMLAAAACGGGGTQSQPTRASRPASPGCTNTASVARRPALRRGPELRGDVDGDGHPDGVVIAVDPAGRSRCRFFLVVRSQDGRRRYATQLTPWGKGWRPIPGDDREVLESLRINGLARIGTDRGPEILVDAHEGASTLFAQVFRVWHGELRRVWGAGESFAYSGSLAHEAGVDCSRHFGAGIVVAGTAWLGGPRGRYYAVEHRFYRLHGSRFVALPGLTTRARVLVGGPGSFGEGFADTAFPSCRTAAVVTTG